MGQLMHDALGIGLAATQLGVMHRVLVYRVEPDAPVAALVNPVLEWSGDETGGARGGLPVAARRARRRRAPDPRPRARAGRARRGDPDRGLGPRGARDPARDGPPRRRADPRPHVARPAQAGDADPARGRAGSAARRGLSRGRRCAPSTSAPRTSRPPCCDRLAATPHRPALVVTRPDAPRGPRAQRSRRRRSPSAARELGHRRSIQPERLHEPEVLERIAAAEPDALVRVRVRRADQGAAALRLRDPQRPPVAAAALARRRAGRAGDHGRRRGDRRLDHAPDRGARLGPGVPAGARADPARRRLRHARRRACAELGGDAAGARARRAPAVRRAGRGGRDLRAEDRGRATARSTRRGRPRRSSASCARCARTSARGCRSPTARSSASSRAQVDGETLAPAGGRVRADGERLLLDCNGGALELHRGPAARRPPRWRAADWLRGRPDPALTDFWLDPRLPGALARRAGRAGDQRVALGRRVAAVPGRARLARRRGGAGGGAASCSRRDDPRARAVGAYVLGQLGVPERTFPAESAAALERHAEARGGPRGAGDDRERVRPPRRAARDRDAAAAAPPRRRARPRGRGRRAGRPRRRARVRRAGRAHARPRAGHPRLGHLRARHAVAAGHAEPLRDALAARLDDSDDDTRIEAVHGLALRGDARALDAVLDLLGEVGPHDDGGNAADTIWKRYALTQATVRLAALTGDARLKEHLPALDERLVGTAIEARAAPRLRAAERTPGRRSVAPWPPWSAEAGGVVVVVGGDARAASGGRGRGVGGRGRRRGGVRRGRGRRPARGGGSGVRSVSAGGDGLGSGVGVPSASAAGRAPAGVGSVRRVVGAGGSGCRRGAGVERRVGGAGVGVRSGESGGGPGGRPGRSGVVGCSGAGVRRGVVAGRRRPRRRGRPRSRRGRIRRSSSDGRDLLARAGVGARGLLDEVRGAVAVGVVLAVVDAVAVGVGLRRVRRRPRSRRCCAGRRASVSSSPSATPLRSVSAPFGGRADAQLGAGCRGRRRRCPRWRRRRRAGRGRRRAPRRRACRRRRCRRWRSPAARCARGRRAGASSRRASRRRRRRSAGAAARGAARRAGRRRETQCGGRRAMLAGRASAKDVGGAGAAAPARAGSLRRIVWLRSRALRADAVVPGQQRREQGADRQDGGDHARRDHAGEAQVGAAPRTRAREELSIRRHARVPHHRLCRQGGALGLEPPGPTGHC